MKLQKAYLRMQKESGIEVGDTVKVLRKAKDCEMGWNNDWCEAMDEFVGKSYIVTGVGSDGILLDYDYEFPFFVLEKVKVKEEPLAVGQWFERDGEKYVLCGINSEYSLVCKSGYFFTDPRNSMEDAFSVYRDHFTRIKEPFTVEPK